MSHPLTDEAGSVVIVVSILLVTLVGISALAIDLGNARQRRAQAQNSADFAALAAAGVLKDSSASEAATVARDYVSKNEFDGSKAEVNIPPTSGVMAGNSKCAEVKPSEDAPTFFGRVWNIKSIKVGARAVACASPGRGGPYAVFAGSTTCVDAVSFSGSNRTINGGVHSNTDQKIKSSGTEITGLSTYLSGDAPLTNITYTITENNPLKLDSPLEYPDDFKIADYAPGGAKAALAVSQGSYHNAGSATINDQWFRDNGLLNIATNTITPGLYYTTGNITFNGTATLGLGVTLVTSSGEISMSGNGNTFTPWDPDGLLLYSNRNPNSCSAGQAAIKTNGNNHSWTGIMFAPQAPIDFSGTSIDAALNGRLVAATVNLSGSTQRITRNETFPGTSGGFELVE
jgi:Flp pilus assembly protein TadG